MDDRLRNLGRAARAEVEAAVDADAELALFRQRTPTDLQPRPLADRPPRTALAWVAALAAVAVVLVGGVWLLRPGADDALQTAQDPPTSSATTAPAVDSATVTTAPAVDPASESIEPVAPSSVATTSTVTPTTQLPIAVSPLVRPGSFELGPDDLIARAVDGDVWWYGGALGTEPSDPILLIDRADPRVEPDQGERPNIIDQVAGTFRGSLVYSDCCEPVSGNLFAIGEPGAESDLWSSPWLSDRARLWGVGYDPQLEPGGTRLLAYNSSFLNLVDLATGEQQFLSPQGGLGDPDHNMTGDPFDAFDAIWTSGGRIALLGWSEDQGLVITEHSPDDLRTELRRLRLDLLTGPRVPDLTEAEFVGAGAGRATIVVYDPDGLHLVDVDTERWEALEFAETFTVPRSASFVRLSPDGMVMAWIVDDVAYLQRVGGEPVAWRDGIAEVWFPTIADAPANTSPAMCLGGATDDAAAVELAGLIVSARRSGSMSGVVGCLDGVPAEFTDIPPACWSSCGDFVQAIADTPIRITEVRRPRDLDIALMAFGLDVSYIGQSGQVDTVENWWLEPTETGLRLVDISFSPPVITRDEAVETLTEYLDAVAAGDWLSAARLLDDGAISPEDRTDLRRLQISDYSYESVAEGLQRWCSKGCVTVAPPPNKLIASRGRYGMTRLGETVWVNWFEGDRSISGLPIRFPAELSAESARDISLDALLAGGHTDAGGDHDVPGSATLGTTSPGGVMCRQCSSPASPARLATVSRSARRPSTITMS